jgi:hypothetical protein
MISISGFTAAVSFALEGVQRGQQMQNAAMQKVAGGSLDPNGLAQAAVALQSGQAQSAASMAALAAGLKQQRSFIDILV